MKILLTGGLGDLFAIEAGWTDEFRSQIREIYWATSRSKAFQSIFDRLPNYNIQRHVELWDDWTQLPAFYNKRHVSDHVVCSIDDVEDWSIGVAWKNPANPEPDSSVLRYKVAEIRPGLVPDDFAVIVPTTTWNEQAHRQTRDFCRADWLGVIRRLEREDRHGIILNTGDKTAPDHPLLTDLSGETTLAESIEILKRANGYYGIDSALSVLAAKLFDRENLWIRARNPHVYKCLKRYYAPHRDYPFVVWTFGDVIVPEVDEEAPKAPQIRLWIRDLERGHAWRPADGDPVADDLSRGFRPAMQRGSTATFQYTSCDLEPWSLESMPDDVREVWTKAGMRLFAADQGYEIQDIADSSVTFFYPEPDESQSMSDEDVEAARLILNLHSRNIPGRVLLHEPSEPLKRLLDGLARCQQTSRIAFAGPGVAFDPCDVSPGGVAWSLEPLGELWKPMKHNYHFRKLENK